MSEREPTLLSVSESTDRHSDTGAACDAAASVDVFDAFGFRVDDEAKPTSATTTSSTTTATATSGTVPTTAVRGTIERSKVEKVFNSRNSKGPVACVGAARRQQRVVARTGGADRVDAVASPEQSAFECRFFEKFLTVFLENYLNFILVQGAWSGVCGCAALDAPGCVASDVRIE
jgi:hypothetical protein